MFHYICVFTEFNFLLMKWSNNEIVDKIFRAWNEGEGPDKRFKTWLISTAMATMNHQYLCKWFYSKKDIDKIINSNYVIEVNEETNTDLIKIEDDDNASTTITISGFIISITPFT